jgi:hypothetical protein
MENFTLKQSKQIETQIKTVKTNGTKIDALIHETAVQCLAHAEAHGDVRLATRLIEAMPKSGRAEALKFWFSEFGPLVWVSQKETGKQFKMDQSDTKIPFNIEGAIETPFWDLVPEPVVSKMSLEKLKKTIKQALDKAAKKAETGEVDGDAFELLEYVHTVQAELFSAEAA